MHVSEDAVEYIKKNTKTYKEPVVAVFERTYRG